jgi:sec-independent protein translocase protein TatC
MLSTVILFFSGVSFAFFVVCPIIFKFFIGMAPDSIQVMTDIKSISWLYFQTCFCIWYSF